MQYFDTPDPYKTLKAIAVIAIGSLAVLITFLAIVTGNDEPQVTPSRGGANPPPTLEDLNVTEQEIPLVDGRTVMCLVFTNPTKEITCDWTTARTR